MKPCRVCGEVFDLSSFHKSRANKDGHVVICRECAKEHGRSPQAKEIAKRYRRSVKGKEAAKKHANSPKGKAAQARYTNSEKGKSYEKNRANLPHRVEARKEYAKSEKGKEAKNRFSKKYTEENRKKRSTHKKVYRAVCSGKLTKPSVCSLCPSDHAIVGHHDDYDKPLEVRWLCSQCHSDWHKENGEALNGY